ncbi:MAG: FAD/NAD(P)-binding protein [Chloroflexi bacterium]|nr:FAD/NAD(P)-binding protein [Chloroflexota bacterium]
MTVHIAPQSMALTPTKPMEPYWAEIVEITPEAPGITTYWLRFLDPAVRAGYTFQPGQFNMLYLPGYGESAISISSDPENHEVIGHTIRYTGNVTQNIARLKVGDVLGVRGPFGTSWPIEQHKGADLILGTGGVGLPPLRPIIYHVMRHRQDYGRVVLLYGARTPKDLQFTREYETWEKTGVETMITVDRADETWTGQVGVVPILFYRLRMDPKKSIVMTCGPEIMIRFVVYEALARRVAPSRIFVSLERNMKCGLGQCGHCQLGPYFVCKDGPVFSFEALEPYFNVEEL